MCQMLFCFHYESTREPAHPRVQNLMNNFKLPFGSMLYAFMISRTHRMHSNTYIHKWWHVGVFPVEKRTGVLVPSWYSFSPNWLDRAYPLVDAQHNSSRNCKIAHSVYNFPWSHVSIANCEPVVLHRYSHYKKIFKHFLCYYWRRLLCLRRRNMLCKLIGAKDQLLTWHLPKIIGFPFLTGTWTAHLKHLDFIMIILLQNHSL